MTESARMKADIPDAAIVCHFCTRTLSDGFAVPIFIRSAHQ
jgi:hypothetical protein